MVGAIAGPGSPSVPWTASPIDTSVPEFRKEGLGYCYEPRGSGIRLRVDYLRERSDEFTGEITVESTLPGVPTHLHQARVNLSSTTARDRLAKHLGTLTPKEKLQWGRLVEQLCVAVLRRERQGEPLQRVGRLIGTLRTADRIERLLPHGKPTLWYGPAGAGKGWMATFAAVCVQTGTPLAALRVRQGNVLYLDWEDSAETLNERVQVVTAGLDLDAAPEIAYRKCRRTLHRDLHAIMRDVADVAADLVIIDSVGLAAGAAGDRGYEDVALTLFDCVRYLEPATVLLIDHVTGEASRENKVIGKAFGSYYKMAEARCAWEVRAEREEGADTSSVGFYHTKFNHSMRYPAMGFRLEFGPSDPGDPPLYVRLRREDLRAGRIAGIVRRAPAYTKDIAELLDEGEPSIRTVLNRYVGRRFIKLQDGRWAPLDTAHDPDGGGA